MNRTIMKKQIHEETHEAMLTPARCRVKGSWVDCLLQWVAYGSVGEVGVQTAGRRELALSDLARNP
jgi:hypothetical protein